MVKGMSADCYWCVCLSFAMQLSECLPYKEYPEPVATQPHPPQAGIAV